MKLLTPLFLVVCVYGSAYAETNYSSLIKSNQLAAARERQAAALAKAWRDRTNQIAATAMVIEGTISRRVGSVLVVRSGHFALERGREHDRFARWASGPNAYVGKGDSRYYATNGLQIYIGELALTQCPRAAELADGERLNVVGYPNGTLEISGRRYRMFTCRMDAVTEVASAATMAELRRPVRD